MYSTLLYLERNGCIVLLMNIFKDSYQWSIWTSGWDAEANRELYDRYNGGKETEESDENIGLSMLSKRY